MITYNFTRQQFEEIKLLLKRRLSENKNQKKISRGKIRKLGFNISDHFYGFTERDFQDLLNTNIISIVNNFESINKINIKTNKIKKAPLVNINKKGSLAAIVDEKTSILILGTVPGDNSIIHQQYYNNPRNQFWKIFCSIFNQGKSIKIYEERIELLKKYNVGLWDVLMSCDREGSSDDKIKNPIVNDFNNFFSKYRNIKTLIFNGEESYKYFNKLVKINFDMKMIQLNSTSSQNGHKNLTDKTEEWRIQFNKSKV